MDYATEGLPLAWGLDGLCRGQWAGGPRGQGVWGLDSGLRLCIWQACSEDWLSLQGAALPSQMPEPLKSIHAPYGQVQIPPRHPLWGSRRSPQQAVRSLQPHAAHIPSSTPVTTCPQGQGMQLSQEFCK